MADTTTLPEQRFTAKLRHARISPQKVRYVATVIRGQNVNTALEILQATNRRAARFLHKLLKSAIANAESITSDRNLDIDVEELRIEVLMVDGGTPLKRWRTAPQGRAVPILKRTSHITLVLGPQPEDPKEKRAAKGTKAAKGEKADAGQAKEHSHDPAQDKGPAVEGQVHKQGHEHPEGHHQHHDHQHRHEPDHKHGGQHEKGHKPPPDKKKG